MSDRNKYMTKPFENIIRKSSWFLKLLISVCFFIFQNASAYSQSDSLINYLEIAANNNPEVLQKFNEYKAALQKVPQVGSLSDPELSLGFFLKPMELVNGKQVADLRLMQMFPWFGVLRSAKDEMSLMANAKFELFRDAKLQVYYDIQRTWYDLFKIEKNIDISERNVEILKSIERLALVKFKAAPGSVSATTDARSSMNQASSSNSTVTEAGMQNMGGNSGSTQGISSKPSSNAMQDGPMGAASGASGLADLYRIQIETGDLQNNIALLINKRNTIVAQFNSYLNRPPQTEVFVPGDLDPDTLSVSLASVTDSINNNNPMLSMLEYESQSLDARKKMVRGMGYPMIGLGLNYSIINKNEMSESPMNGKDMIMPMVSVTLPVYRKKYNAMVSEADYLKASVLNKYDAVSNNLQSEYYQAVQLYQDAQRRVVLYDNQLRLASKSLDIILKGFSASTSSLTDVLRIHQQTLDYELKKADAIADLNTASALLKRLMASSQIN